MFIFAMSLNKYILLQHSFNKVLISICVLSYYLFTSFYTNSSFAYQQTVEVLCIKNIYVHFDIILSVIPATFNCETKALRSRVAISTNVMQHCQQCIDLNDICLIKKYLLVHASRHLFSFIYLVFLHYCWFEIPLNINTLLYMKQCIVFDFN